MKKAMLGNLLLLFAALIWGFAFVAQVVSVDSGLGPVSFNAIRFGIGAIVLIPVIMIFDRKKKEGQRTKDLVIGSLLSGVMLFFAANLQQYALTVNANPGLAGFITALYTVWTPVAYFLVFKKKTTANVWIAVAVKREDGVQISVTKNNFVGNRERIKFSTSTTAIINAIKMIKNL